MTNENNKDMEQEAVMPEDLQRNEDAADDCDAEDMAAGEDTTNVPAVAEDTDDAEGLDAVDDCDAVDEEDRDIGRTATAATEAATIEQTGANVTVESVVEAILFASDEPLTLGRLADIVGTAGKQIKEHIEHLNERYAANNSAFRIEKIAGGFQMLTLSAYNHWLKKLLRARQDSRLSPAALETLAIVAYKQPIIRADIEAIRGVSAGEVTRSLMYKGLVKIVGRAEVLGRPMLYGTTKKFLEVFGLNSLKDLPKAEELKRPQ